MYGFLQIHIKHRGNKKAVVILRIATAFQFISLFHDMSFSFI